MADKIDQLKVKDTSGNDQVYDIDLPPNAEPNITSLTASGLANVAGLIQTGEDADKIITSGGAAKAADWTLAAGTGITFQGTVPTIINGTTPPSQCANSSQAGYLYSYYQENQSSSTSGAIYSKFSFNNSGSDRLRIVTGLAYVGTVGKDSTYTGSVTFAIKFDNTPEVVITYECSGSSAMIHTRVSSVSATSFSYALRRPSGAAAVSNVWVYWTAIGIY